MASLPCGAGQHRAGARAVFQVHQEHFRQNIDLGTLVPKLFSKGVLTDLEYEEVTYLQHYEHVRKTKLIRILRTKADSALSLIVECFREADKHPAHAELADLIEGVQNDECDVDSSTLTRELLPPQITSVNPTVIGSETPSANFSEHVDRGGVLPMKKPCDAVAHSASAIPQKRPGSCLPSDDALVYSSPAKRRHLPYSSEEFASLRQTSPSQFGQQYIPSFREPHTEIPVFPVTTLPTSLTVPLLSEAPHLSQQNSRSSLTPALHTLAETLKGTYRDKNFFKKTAGPDVGQIEFINLALVKKQGVSDSDKALDIFLKSSLHGTIDDIVKKKVGISHQDIFNYSSDGRKLVLVEGAPGVGKTMLAMKLCVDWANGECLQEYDLVMLVQLRRFQAKSKINLEDLVGINLGESEATKEASGDLLKCHNKVLLILEGWDELPPAMRKEMTFFFDIITGDKLPQASVMVTSRPSVTSPLYDYMDERHIEVLGFTSDDIDAYIRKHTSDAKARVIMDHLKQFPNLRALAHVPLTLAIICKLVKGNASLPPTLTQLYESHICNTILPKLKHQGLISSQGIQRLDELDNTPREVINALSKLALDGFKKKAFVFKKEDLLQVGLPYQEGFDGYGLLSTITVAATAGHDCFYQFRHLSIQEYLAAYSIKELESDNRLQHLKDYRDDLQFQNVWKFLAGITKLRDESLRKLVISETTQANRAQLFLLHCLYEAHDPQVCCLAAGKVKRTINLTNITLNATDCLCAAYVITAAGEDWEIRLRGANIGEDGLEIFKSHLLRHLDEPESERTDVNIKMFDLAHNRISGGAIDHLAQMCRSKLQLEKIDLASNKIRDDGMVNIAGALAHNHTVTHLHFSNCGFTSSAARSIGDMLKENGTIENIYLGFEPIGDEGLSYFASAMKENHSLKELSLTKTKLTVVGLKAFAEMMAVNRTLEVIRFDRNELGHAACTVIGEIIAKNDSVTLIDLSKNPIGDRGFEIVLGALISKPKSPLKKLGVYGCKITKKSLSQLVEVFAVTDNFAGIQLGCNDIGDEGAELIVNALNKNSHGSKSVKQVLLESTNISKEGRKKLVEAVKSLQREMVDLDVNFDHHAQVYKQREKMN